MDIKQLDGWGEFPFSNREELRIQSTLSIEDLVALEAYLENQFEGFLYDIYQEQYYIHHNDSDYIHLE